MNGDKPDRVVRPGIGVWWRRWCSSEFKIFIVFWSKFIHQNSLFLAKILISKENFDFGTKFWFWSKLSTLEENFDFWPKISIAEKSNFPNNLIFATIILNYRFLTKISIFAQNFNFWTKFQLLNKISIFEQNFYFWTKFQFLNKISIFEQNFNFWP